MERLTADAVTRGATVALGGERVEGPGYFYPPTVLTDVPADALVMTEEPFGPIAPIVSFTELDEALAQANSLPYGLAAYGFTESAATAERLAGGLQAGIVSVNHCGGSVHEAPSGGMKDSGYGREGGPEGLDGYLVTKRVSHLLMRLNTMRYTRVAAEGMAVGRVHDEHVELLSESPLAGRPTVIGTVATADAVWLPPVVPPVFYAVGLNYTRHIEHARALGNTAAVMPERPEIGYRANNALTGHLSPIVKPRR